MIDTSLEGVRCRATQEIRSHQGSVRRSTEGTVEYEIENLDRHLIRVHWDNGLITYVFFSEIEIIGGDCLWQ